MDWGHVARDYGGHILGFLGLAQVWVIALWRRFVSRAKLEVHPTANIEIGFSGFGPTVTLLGTLRAREKGVFVREMRVRVVRDRNRAEHEFTWRAFRPSSISIGAQAQQTLEIASSFLVSPESPHRYNVFFASAAFASEYQSDVQPLRDEWQRFVEQKIRQVNPNLVGQIGRVLENPALSSQLFSEFNTAGHATDLHARLSNHFFWHAGTYRLHFTAETDGRLGPVARSWRFELTPAEESALRLNIIAVIRELCFLPVVYNFAYKPYQSAA